jgi:hypothetical protein
LAKNFRGSDAFSANGAASQVSLGHRLRDSMVAELTSAEGANQLRFQGRHKAGTKEQPIESRFQRWRVLLCYTILGRCPRLVLNAAPLALNSKRPSGDRRSLIAVVGGNS